MIRKFSILIIISILFGENLSIENIPVQEAGRIKPLHTIAENQLLLIYERKSIKGSDEPTTDWFMNLLLYPEAASNQKIYKVKSKDVATALNLDWNNSHLYSFNDLAIGIENNIPNSSTHFNDLANSPRENLSFIDKQLLGLYNKMVIFQLRSLSFINFLPINKISNEDIAEFFNIKSDTLFSYQDFIKSNESKYNQLKDNADQNEINYYFNAEKFKSINSHINSHKEESEFCKYCIEKTSDENINNQKKMITDSLMMISDNLQKSDPIIYQIEKIKSNIKRPEKLKIIPPFDSSRVEWLSIPEMILENAEKAQRGEAVNTNQLLLIEAFEDYIDAYYNNDHESQLAALQNYNEVISRDSSINFNNLYLEVWYNKADLFYYSIICYILAFVLLGFKWIFNSHILRKISFAIVSLGLLLHGSGIIIRMIIMSRPPVSTLYESIIFVGFITVLSSLIFEKFRKDGIGTLLASVLGATLHFIGFGYENDGETLQVLVAVLNSNFWLATHVTTIAIGYGTTAVASLMGHVYFLVRLINRSSRGFLKQLSNNMVALNLIALFFMLFGTILGGIWADQSWGRFWGWDPKENAALLIVMWQLLMVHLRISGFIKPLGFAFGMIMSSIFLAFGWFGVNLLGIGLHSYGFTDSIFMNLCIFILCELWFGISFYYLIKDTRG